MKLKVIYVLYIYKNDIIHKIKEMNTKLYEKSFYEPNSSFLKSRYVFVPVPLEKTVSYSGGTDKGPDAILDASFQIDTFNEILMVPVSNIRSCVIKPIDCLGDHLKILNKVSETISHIYIEDKIPITLGGEHSITPGIIKGVMENFDDLTVIQIDAHSDTRESYENDKLSHASAMYNILNSNPNIELIQIAIRSLSIDEITYREQFKDRITTFWDYQIYKEGFDNILSKLNTLIQGKNVYLTVDVDGLDFINSSTGTPEPGGISYYAAIDLFRNIVLNSNLIGADFVELAPVEGFHSSDFYVAKLICNLIVFMENLYER